MDVDGMKRYISILLVIIWMFVIFMMSSFNGDVSSSQSNFIVDLIVSIFNISDIDIISLVVRKSAHYMEYLILGLLVINMLDRYDIDKRYVISIVICIIYAISDEVHQIFVDGRCFMVRDILIDSTGGLSGIYLYKLFLKGVFNRNGRS